MPLGLYALAIGGFGIGLTEFIIAGILSELARDLGVTIPEAGQLVSVYALAVAVGAIILTAALGRIAPKKALLLLMVLFIVGNLLSAIAPGYGVMMLGRIVAALCHGAFFGIGAVLAAELVPAAKKAGAIAIMFTGLTLANVLGIPFGTFLAQQAGWRATFWAITAIGVVALLGILALVHDKPRDSVPSLKAELAAFRSGQVWFSLLMTVFVFGGMFGTFMYVEPLLVNVTGYSTASIPWLLVLFGVGLFLGNIAGGRAADKNLSRTLLVLLVAMPIALAAFAVLSGNPWLAAPLLFLLGGVGFATVPGLQMRVLQFAKGAPTLASGANIAAFNLGNALGVALGGATIAAGLGFSSPAWAGALMGLAGLLTFLLARWHQQRPSGRQVQDVEESHSANVVRP